MTKQKTNVHDADRLTGSLEAIEGGRLVRLFLTARNGPRLAALFFLLLESLPYGELESHTSLGLHTTLDGRDVTYRSGVDDVLPLLAEITLEALVLSAHFLFLLFCLGKTAFAPFPLFVATASLAITFLGLVCLPRDAQPLVPRQTCVRDIVSAVDSSAELGRRCERADKRRIERDGVGLDLVEQALDLALAPGLLVLEGIRF
ncbi:hypothetical protein NUW54_g5577 [Trametes sanguinea]|uniref:Uncharacterized protein n=1 Tax=Trametes sanguinea TaxID=158606 RepID=A0ACC1PXE4_9APHY|nr:hypothetical protein NUW54_g5577 [Trametes sanguinea]